MPPHPSTVHDAATGGYAVHPQQAAAQPGVQSLNQSAEFFLSNYRLGKTLGIGSFGKVSKHATLAASASYTRAAIAMAGHLTAAVAAASTHNEMWQRSNGINSCGSSSSSSSSRV